MRLVAIALACLATLAGAGAAPELRENAALFLDAVKIARDARTKEELAEAISRYERIIQTGLRNGHILYNLGNAYYRAGDPGRAILNWRRADRLAPGITEIAHNLDYARSRLPDKFETESASEVLAIVCFWHAWPFPTRCLVALSFFTLLWVLLGVRLWLRAWGVTALAGGAAAAFLLVGISAAITYRHEGAAPPGVMIAEQTVVRQGNYKESEAVFNAPVHSGTEVRLIETREAWVRVEFPNGKDGWVPRETVERI